MSRTIVRRLMGLTILTLPACSNTEPIAVDAPTPANHARPINPAEYKLKLAYIDVKETANLTTEILFRAGRSYQFLGESSEVIVVEPEQKVIRFLDLRRQATSELKFTQIETLLELYRKQRAKEIADDLKLDTRAAQLEAAMKRDLLDPHFHVEAQETSHRLRFTNATVDVIADGEPESDTNRRDRIAETLALTIKLRTLRFPEAIPPFANLEALHTLLKERNLRPIELTFLFRLTGPPEKYRWRYTLVPTLTDREWEALRRIDRLLLTTKALPFNQYERLIERVQRQ